MNVNNLVDLNVLLNLITATFLTLGFVQIKRGNKKRHKKLMVSALISTICFLTSYLIYHYHVGSVPYPYHDWTRTVYFTILIPHVILAALQIPFIVIIVWRAFHDDFAKHKRMARIVWPVWMFVSISGITVYAMLYLR